MLPKRTQETIDRYVQHGIRMGGFLEACFASDFIRAIQMVDQTNLRALKYIVDYMLEFVPREAMGSYEAVDKWMLKKRDEK